MLRIERGPGSLTLVSRFSRPRALVVLASALGLAALLSARASAGAAAALCGVAVLVAVVGGRAVRAVFAGDRVRVRAGEWPISGVSAVRVETLAEARRRKAERHAHAYRARAGGDLPSWLRPGDQPGANDHLRRLVLVREREEPLPVTAWLAEDDLEAARREVEGVIGRG